MNREPNGDACLTNSDVDHFADVVANLKSRLDEAERSKALAMLSLVIAAGGRIQVSPSDMQQSINFELIQTVWQQSGDVVFEARRKLP